MGKYGESGSVFQGGMCAGLFETSLKRRRGVKCLGGWWSGSVEPLEVVGAVRSRLGLGLWGKP